MLNGGGLSIVSVTFAEYMGSQVSSLDPVDLKFDTTDLDPVGFLWPNSGRLNVAESRPLSKFRRL